MRKIILTFLILFLLSQITYASESRWKFICDTNVTSVYIDNNTWKLTKTDSNKSIIDCWFKTREKDSFIINHMLYYPHNLNFLMKESNQYNNDGKLMASWDSTNLGWIAATPGTNIEIQLSSTNEWISNKVKLKLK